MGFGSDSATSIPSFSGPFILSIENKHCIIAIGLRIISHYEWKYLILSIVFSRWHFSCFVDEQFKGSEVCGWPWSCAHCCSTFAVKHPWFKNIIRDLKLVDQTHYKYLNSGAGWTKAQKESKAISRIRASPIHNESLPFLVVSKFTNSSWWSVLYCGIEIIPSYCHIW